MNNLMICLFTLWMSIFSSVALAASASKTLSGGKGDIAWFAVGSGSNTVRDPKAIVDLDATLLAAAGIDGRIFGPLGFSISIAGMTSQGFMKYDYTSPDNTHYTSSRMKVTTSGVSLQAGLQISLINMSFVRLFATGGGFVSSWEMKYESESPIYNSFPDTQYQVSQKDMVNVGTYAEAGLEFFVINGYGLRFMGRVANGRTSKVDALANKQMTLQEVEGLVAITHRL